MASDAVGLDRISRIVGYKITKGDFSASSPNLPVRIAIIGEANEANQGSLNLAPVQVTSARQAGELYGFGSPIYLMMRILRPVNSEGVGGIPTVVYPQAKAPGATAKVVRVESIGTANKNGVHTLIIAGRTNIDGDFYNINIQSGDTTAVISQKIEDAVNNVLGSPVIPLADDYGTDFTTKWAGLSANGLSITVDTGDDDLGLTYIVTDEQAGAGTPDIQDALDLFGSDWITHVVNGYGTVAGIMTTLETFNGIPSPDNPTGRYSGIIMKPFTAITGSTAEDPSTITEPRKEQVTIAMAPAPLSAGLHFEAAANMTALSGPVAQNTPHLDVSGKPYPDMPTPASIGAMAIYDNRDAIVKKGCSTVDLKGGRYVVQDFVTTYHPIGENPPQFRYVRSLTIDWNVRYTYYLLEEINVVDHAIANDNDIVNVSKVVKPKQWKQILFTMADDVVLPALVVDAEFMKNSVVVNISTTNPERFESFFRYKRSGYARISSTTAEAGFNFGTLN
jgi:phage tail sheath gpL-like